MTFLVKLRYKGMIIDRLDYFLDTSRPEYSHDIVREIACDYLQINMSRFAESKEDDTDNYIDQLKVVDMSGELVITALSKHF